MIPHGASSRLLAWVGSYDDGNALSPCLYIPVSFLGHMRR